MPYLQIVRVISNKKFAPGREKAKAASIPEAYHNILPYYPNDLEKLDPDAKAAAKAAAREKYDADLAGKVLADNPDIVVCAGFMHILSPKFLDPLAEKNVPVINLHPAKPGQYDGINAIQRAYDDYHKGKLEGDKTGLMIHYVVRLWYFLFVYTHFGLQGSLKG
jgi:phosphoribosylglycinamide formyltransferase